jgi:ABC transporter substrate binding protein (PQQ-dependent alcohol dehydrogenase system)
MNGRDWASWMAVRSVTEAIVRIKSSDVQEISSYLVSESATFDGYKGVPVNFRRWNNQLRQPILLHVHNAVIARAPIDGFLHRSNTLDTLGLDHPESSCNFQGN